MRRIQVTVAGLLTAGSLLLAAPIARADTPTPTPGTPSCAGQIVATFNHASGIGGPSGNPNASAGPGVFLHQDTHAAILDARSANCTTP
jgi:hypothetical protein